ncbi:MAG TPA: ABC transporter ATP-binding protein [Candidatus Saccharimonas sp.]|nr:ABC transporter ATP-binding protein [Candidatus Saccharimonas sp.]
MTAQKMTSAQILAALWNVARTTYRAAPVAVVVKLVGSVIEAVLPLIVAYYAAATTTSLAAAYGGDSEAGSHALVYVFITAGLGLFSLAWSGIASYIGELVKFKIDAEITDELYHHFASLEYHYYDNKEVADMFDKAQNFAFYFSRFFDDIAAMISAIVRSVTAIVAISIVAWWLSPLLLLAVLPSMYFQLRLSRLQSNHWKKNVVARRTMGQIKWSVFQPRNIAELRIYGLATHMINWHAELRAADEKGRILFERSYIGKRLLAQALEALVELGVLIYVVLQVIARQQPVGQFLYVQQMVSQTLGSTRSLITRFSGMDEDLATLFDYEQFMKLKRSDDSEDTAMGAPDTIRVENLSFVYPLSKQRVLQDVSLTIRRNQHVAIVGENGAGKSTLVKLLLGLYEPTKGRILLDDKDLSAVKKSSWHRLLGVLKQDFMSFWFTTVRNNVALGDVSRPYDEDRFRQALVRAEAKKFVDALPQGVDTFVDKWAEDDDGNPGTDLSGGQWQRLVLARNFYRDSPIIILDEPTSAIDALAESRIFDHLFADKTRTVITISHRLSTVGRADVVYMMKKGRVVESGTHDDLVALRGEYYTMFKSQLHE